MLSVVNRRSLVLSALRRTTTIIPCFETTTSVNMPSLQRLVPLGQSHRSFSMAPDENSNAGEYLIGQVKFYNRAKYYGFIVPFNQPDLDVFVHRSDIVSDLPHDEHPRFPSLGTGERVRFQLDWVEDESDGTQKPHARRVTFSNGTRVPPLRKSFWRKKLQDIQDELGKNVFTIMTDDSNVHDNDPQEKWKRIQGAWEIAKTRFDSAKALVDRVGMKVEDFQMEEEPNATGANGHRPWKRNG